MEPKTILILFIAILFIIFGLFYYFTQKRFLFMNQAIESIQHQVMEQRKTIEQQEYLFQQIFPQNVLNQYYSFSQSPSSGCKYPSPQIPITEPENITMEPSTIPNIDLNNVLPMMGSLLNVFGGNNNQKQSSYKFSDENNNDNLFSTPVSSPSKIENIDDELSEELKELELNPIHSSDKEGRLDEDF
jgi:hypothetical protein